NGRAYDCYLEYDVDFNAAYYNDEFFLLNGYERYAATKSEKLVSWSAGGSVSLSSTDVMRFYYSRNSYNLTYFVGGSNVNTTSVKYDAPLSGYLTLHAQPSRQHSR
ncbi:MAG: hypothetical protein IJT94_01975, partial [Oscillibacter sp.]|nr:hypothetical protein [Oscillibacter sp.]